MNVKVGISNRHVHLTEEDFKILFGDVKLEKRNDLSQKGEFASNFVVKLIGPKNSISNVRVLGPFRDYTQVEISKTDCYTLGINCFVTKESGDLSNASSITIANGNKEIVRKACIIANRHIHITKEERKKYNLLKDQYSVKVAGEKSGIMENIYIKENDDYVFELHLDTDDANAFLLKDGDFVSIIDD